MFSRKRNNANHSSGGTSHLRQLLASTERSADLVSIPDRLTTIFQVYDSLDVDPQYRADIFNVLHSSVCLAETLADNSFSSEAACEQIADQIEILSRALRYLQRRPVKRGFSILNPATQTLVGQFSTQGEAESQLKVLIALGATAACEVVPVKIQCQSALQPKAEPSIEHQAQAPQASPTLSQRLSSGVPLPQEQDNDQPDEEGNYPEIPYNEEAPTESNEAALSRLTADLESINPTKRNGGAT